MRALVGLPRYDALNRSLAQLLGASGEGDIKSWPQIAAGRLPVQFEWLLRSSPGRQQTWVLVDIQPLPLQGGNTARAVVTFHDITERRRATERLAEMQARVEMALGASHAALWDWNLDTDEILVDGSIKAWLGYEPDEVRRRTDWLARLHPDDVAALTALGETIIRDVPPSFEFVARIATKAGNYCSLLGRGCVVRSPQGDARRIIGLAVDISERKRTIELLQEQQRRFMLATVAGRVSVFDYDLATGEIYTDPAFTEIMGLGTTAALSRESWLRRVHPDDVERLLALEASALAKDTGTDANGNAPIPEVECRLIADNGEIVWLLLRGTMLRTADGVPHRIVGTATDITRHRRTEEALRESEARYRSLTGRLLQAQDEERRRIAQDLHGVTLQNLSALAMDLTRLEQLLGSGEQTVKRLLEESQALVAAAVNEVRTLSYVLHPPLLDEAGLLPGIKWYIKGFSARSGIDAKLRAPSRMERLPRDLETALYRVMQECLTNIHRHSGSSSARISLRKTATDVVLRVSDRGHGMEDAESGPDAIASVGVGIAGMRQRLRQLGGTLDIRSTRQGTTVVASVPILKESNDAPNPGGGRP